MKILIAIDHSAASQTVIEEVASRPWPAGSEFEALSVVDATAPWITEEVIQEASRQAKITVERPAQRLGQAGLQVAAEVAVGDPKQVIVDRASAWHADLIVMGPHNGRARFLLGSVAKAVIRMAPCSVELVRPRTGVLTKVLLATDGSDFSMAAARSLVSRPWPEGTEVRALSAVEYHLPFLEVSLEPAFLSPVSVEKLREEAMRRAQNAIQSAVEILAAAGLSVSEALSVLVESPKQVILDEAERWGAGMIVLGSHGYRGLNRFLLGGISEAVAMHAPCSVEVIRSGAVAS